MLDTALRIVDTLTGGLSGPAATRAVDVLSRLRVLRADLIAFTATAADRIAALDQLTAAQGLAQLSQDFRSWQEKVTPLCAELDEVRRGFADDVAGMRAQQDALRVKVADRERWVEQGEDVRELDTVTAVFSAFLPFAGDVVGRELESVIKHGRTSDEVLAEANAHLAEIAAADAAIAGLDHVIAAVTHAIGAVQNLDNALSLLGADLDEESRVAACASAETLALFRTSLTAGIQVLRVNLEIS